MQVAAFASATLCQFARITTGSEEKGMAKSVVEDHGDDAKKQRLISAVKRVLSPQRVNDVRITHEDAGLVLGFIRTSCPLEKQSLLEDFEAHLHGKDGRFLDYVVIGGRRMRFTRSGRRPLRDRQVNAAETGKSELTSS